MPATPIQQLHERVFQFLRSSYPTSRFTLRERNRSERLSKGYWFSGNDNYLVFSFWSGRDWRNKTPHIYLEITAGSERCSLVMVDTDGGDKAQFFNKISEALGMSRVVIKKDEERFVWRKQYLQADCIKATDEFLRKDKPILDAFIKSEGKEELFPPVPKDVFEDTLSNVEDWRRKLNNGKSKSSNGVKMTEQPVRLKHLVLHKIGHFQHLEIKLDKQVTCIAGENGSGKSTVLRAIALALAGVSDNTIVNPESDAIQNLLQIREAANGNVAYAEEGYIEIHYKEQNKNIVRFSNAKEEFADTHGRIRRLNKVDDFGSDLTATSGNEFKNLVLGFAQIKSAPEERGQKDAALGEKETKIARIADVAPLIYNRPDDCFEHFRTWILALSNPETSPEKRKKHLQLLSDIFQVITEITGNKTALVPLRLGQSEVFVRTTDAPAGIPMRLLSQGYNNVIGWVGYFMQRLWEVTPDGKDFSGTPAICLLDEADTYLHPKWQLTILATLARHFPNTQFVVTTHSALNLATLKNDYRIYNIRKNQQGEFVALEHSIAMFNPYGASSSRVLESVMDTEERPRDVSKLLTQYFDFIDRKQWEKAEEMEAKLKKLIDPSDPDIVRGESLMDAAKILQSL